MIELIDLGEIAKPIPRPDCIGMRGAKIVHTENYLAGALHFSAFASSDEDAVPFEQWLVVARGQGWVSVGREQIVVRAGHVVKLPRNAFHRFWTDAEEMDALVLAFQIARGVELVRLPDRAVLAHNAATRFVALARESIHARGRFAVALSGG